MVVIIIGELKISKANVRNNIISAGFYMRTEIKFSENSFDLIHSVNEVPH